MKLSVVIPTLNEASGIGALLNRLYRTPGIYEVIVADGGSTDETRQLLVSAQYAPLVRSEPGRGIQLRAGAEAATGDVILFLHADVVPPPDVSARIKDAIGRGCVGGNFRLRYPEGGLLGWWLERLAPFYRKLGKYYGDSGIFVRRDVYEAFGGMPHVPIMEDVILVRRLEAAGPTAYLPGPLFSDARRWSGRPFRTLALWSCMQTAFALGATPWQLAHFYRSAKG